LATTSDADRPLAFDDRDLDRAIMKNLLKRLKTSRNNSLSAAQRRPTHTGGYLRQRESARGLSGKLSLSAAPWFACEIISIVSIREPELT